MNSDPLNALVLAGDRPGETDRVARDAGVSCKAFAPVGGRPMIERVLQVLQDSGRFERIVVSIAAKPDLAGQAPRLSEWLQQGCMQRLEPEASPARSVAAALDGLSPGASPVLVTTADHALLDELMLDQFLERCRPPGMDVFAGFVPLELVESAYPETRRTGLKLRGGRYSGCNLFLLNPGAGVQSLLAFWMRLEELRKSPWRMAVNVGPAALIAYALRLLSLRQALDRIGARAGARLAPVVLDTPRAAIDVDSPRDLAFVEALLARQAAGG